MKEQQKNSGVRRRSLRAGLVTCVAVALSTAAGMAQAQVADAPVVTPFIIGGNAVPQGKYPFIVSVHMDGLAADPRTSHQCGGTLLTPVMILTAAHCLSNGTELTFDPAKARIVINRSDLGTAHGEVRGIAYFEEDQKHYVHIHPEFRKGPGAFPNDVAIIGLDAPVHGIEPVYLPSPGSDVMERPGQTVTTAGWGNTSPYPGVGISPAQLMAVAVPMVSSLECKFAYGASLVPKLMLCAGRSGFDSCQGDSGGPLFVSVPGTSAVIQTGVVSWGGGCAQIGMPGVYARLSDPGINAFIQHYAYGMTE